MLTRVTFIVLAPVGEGEKVFSNSATRKIGFNPATNVRYVEPEHSIARKPQMIHKLPLSGLGAEEVMEITDEEE